MKAFVVKHKGKFYYVDYVNSDGQTLMLSNRNYWEVVDDEFYCLEDIELEKKVIKFCIRHFNDYKPKIFY